MGYWDETHNYLSRHGNRGPKCHRCGKEMFPADDHGRFSCLCNLGSPLDTVTGRTLDSPVIPQVDTSGMSDAEKAKIDPINRMNDVPTSAEQEVLQLLAEGKIDTPEYAAAKQRLHEERSQAPE